jgi:hypothetical protein
MFRSSRSRTVGAVVAVLLATELLASDALTSIDTGFTICKRFNSGVVKNVLAITLLTLASTATAATVAEKPNIIYIMMDEWGYFEWSAMGHPILRTPNIDKMAAEGMRLTQMLAGGNVCAPTRSALMTGQHTGHTTVRIV